MTKKQSNFSIAMLIFIAVFGITNIPNNYATLGVQSIFWFTALILYFIPIALIIAELASFNPNSNSGISGWVKLGTTKKLAFICGWAYFIENIFYLPMLASRVPVFISWSFADIDSLELIVKDPSSVSGIISASNSQLLFLVLTFLTLFISVIMSLYFEKIFNKIGKFVGIVSLALAFGFILLSISSVFVMSTQPVYPITTQNIMPHFNASTISSLVWVIFAIGGIETIGSVVNEIDNPNKRLPKIVLFGSILVIIAYTIGILGLSFIMSPTDLTTEALDQAIPVMFAKLGLAYGLNGTLGILFIKFVMVMQTIITISALVLWFVATINVLFVESDENVFPKWIEKKTNNKPINAMIFTSILIVIFLTLSSNASNTYYMLYDMSTIAMVVPFILLLISYIEFKRKDMNAGYTFIKNKLFAIIVGYLLLAVTCIAFIFGIFDPSLLNNQIKGDFISWALISGCGLLFFMVIGYVIYLRKEKPKIALILSIILILIIAYYLILQI